MQDNQLEHADTDDVGTLLTWVLPRNYTLTILLQYFDADSAQGEEM